MPLATFLAVNMEAFRSFTAEASAAGADVIVFPEDALYWPGDLLNTRDTMFRYCETIPAAGPNVNPCTDASLAGAPHQILRNLSCLAREFNIIVASPMAEYVTCEPGGDPNCPEDGRYQYNSLLAFESNGALVAKYRKSYLAGEALVFDQPVLPDPVTFTATFGVTFGLFICFDIQHALPSQAYFGAGVRNVITSVSWVNSPPAYNAVMLQQGWSRVYQSNLLAANNNGAFTTSGGGIYSCGEPLAVAFNASAVSTSAMQVRGSVLLSVLRCSDSVRAGCRWPCFPRCRPCLL
jgi:predicted amidohydrolase